MKAECICKRYIPVVIAAIRKVEGISPSCPTRLLEHKKCAKLAQYTKIYSKNVDRRPPFSL